MAYEQRSKGLCTVYDHKDVSQMLSSVSGVRENVLDRQLL